MRLNRLLAAPIAAVVLTLAALSQTLPQGVQKVASVEGLTEYAFPNGLHALLFPDNSKPKVTVNVTYLAGSRQEGYGETGMAHLLEHMVFKTTRSGREVFKELTDRTGGMFNGTTNYDATMYFEILNASDENLRWALRLEAERMVDIRMVKADLDKEMTVVRNEMEAGENSPFNILQQRVLETAYSFHNYGKTVIGNRSDVEKVPIDRLEMFYRKYYQPDNAVVILAGQFDESKALAYIMETLGAIPRPQRILPPTYTVEPVQDGERLVTLRRVGDTQAIMAAYHAPAAMHSDRAALDVLGEVLGANQTGRLYKALVDSRKAVTAGMGFRAMHDPGFLFAFVMLRQDQSLDDAQQTLLKTVEGVIGDPPTQEEVDRAKARILKNYELRLTDSETIGLYVSSFLASGDWRLLFLTRDEVKKVTPDDVARVAKAYLKSSNRTLGQFIPTRSPDRAEIPATPEVAARLKDYKGGQAIQEGEAFVPTPRNVEGRVIRARLPNGVRLVMLPKKTRGGTVFATINIRFGDEKSLFGRSEAAGLAGGLLMRGTRNKNRQQIQDETDRLKAQINVFGGATAASGRVQTLEANLEGSLRLLRELLRESSFPEAEFEQVRQQRIAGIETMKSEPQAVVSVELQRHMNSRYPRGDVRYAATFDEQVENLKKVTLADVRDFYARFFGPGEGEIAVCGQFDPATVQKLVTGLFGDWKSAARYDRILNPYVKVEPIDRKLETPDKQNAVFYASMFAKMTDEDPDLAAVEIAGMALGGSPNSRLFRRIRIQEGLSYGAGAGFMVPTKDDGGRFFANAIAAPQNMPKLEAVFKEEVAKALKDGFTADEVEKAKKAWQEQRTVSRADDSSLAGLLLSRERWGRTMDWDARLEAAVAALTPQQVGDALRRHLDPAGLSYVKGGDFKKAGVYQ